jgi:hypothetical protein
MNTTYTPGPWTAKQDQDSTGATTIRANGINICFLSYYNKGVKTLDPYEVEANARLIAAAPELLEALQNLVQFVEWREDFIVEDHKEGEDNQYSEALTAIQKATQP